VAVTSHVHTCQGARCGVPCNPCGVLCNPCGVLCNPYAQPKNSVGRVRPCTAVTLSYNTSHTYLCPLSKLAAAAALLGSEMLNRRPSTTTAAWQWTHAHTGARQRNATKTMYLRLRTSRIPQQTHRPQTKPKYLCVT